MAKQKDEKTVSEMTAAELRAEVAQQRDRLFQLRFQSATAPLKNPRSIRATRRAIARALTFLRQRGESA